MGRTSGACRSGGTSHPRARAPPHAAPPSRGDASGDDRGPAGARRSLPLPRGSGRDGRDHHPPRAGARVPRAPDQARRELRRRRHRLRVSHDGRAADRRRPRREQAHRLRGASDRAQPVPRQLPGARARGRGARAQARRLRSGLRQPRPRRSRPLPVPLLGERRDAADVAPAHEHRVRAGSPCWSPRPTPARA